MGDWNDLLLWMCILVPKLVANWTLCDIGFILGNISPPKDFPTTVRENNVLYVVYIIF